MNNRQLCHILPEKTKKGVSLVPRLSLPLRRRESLVHVHNIKSRHEVDTAQLHVGMHGSQPTKFRAHDQGKHVHSTKTTGYSSLKSQGRLV